MKIKPILLLTSKYTWTVPTNLAAGSDYRIKISGGSTSDFSDSYFSIKPEITVTSPNGGSQLEVGKQYQINWEDNISENVRLDLYKGSFLLQTISASTPSDGEFLWSVPTNLAESSDYRIKISRINDNDNLPYSNISSFSNSFTIHSL